MGNAVRSINRPPRVCLCGRPNVGKSSLFNRLLGRKKALVLDEPGVTRDVYKARVHWEGHEIEIADLAGLELLGERSSHGRPARNEKNPEETLKRLSTDAALDYLREADLVLFVVDGRDGLTPADEELARVVRSTGRPVKTILSKAEGKVEDEAQSDAALLGWGMAISTSAEHNRGINELKQTIVADLFGDTQGHPTPSTDDENSLDHGERGSSPQRPVRLGVYGRPNVGKSTLVNTMLGEKRMITSSIAGTTVDTIDTDFEHKGRFYRILDTAGIRRKSKTEQGVEVLSVVQALKSLPDVDIALFLIDGYEGVTDQDEKVAGEIIKTGKPVVIVVNKWDLCRTTKDEYAERLRKALAFLDFAPILFISAELNSGIEPLWDLVGEIMRQRMIVAPTAELNRFIEMVEGTNNPTGVRLFYASQVSKNPPTIAFMVSDPKKVHFAYERYLRHELRGRYGWLASPLRLIFRARKRSESKKARKG